MRVLCTTCGNPLMVTEDQKIVECDICTYKVRVQNAKAFTDNYEKLVAQGEEPIKVFHLRKIIRQSFLDAAYRADENIKDAIITLKTWLPFDIRAEFYRQLYNNIVDSTGYNNFLNFLKKRTLTSSEIQEIVPVIVAQCKEENIEPAKAFFYRLFPEKLADRYSFSLGKTYNMPNPRQSDKDFDAGLISPPPANLAKPYYYAPTPAISNPMEVTNPLFAQTIVGATPAAAPTVYYILTDKMPEIPQGAVVIDERKKDPYASATDAETEFKGFDAPKDPEVETKFTPFDTPQEKREAPKPAPAEESWQPPRRKEQDLFFEERNELFVEPEQVTLFAEERNELFVPQEQPELYHAPQAQSEQRPFQPVYKAAEQTPYVPITARYDYTMDIAPQETELPVYEKPAAIKARPIDYGKALRDSSFFNINPDYSGKAEDFVIDNGLILDFKGEIKDFICLPDTAVTVDGDSLIDVVFTMQKLFLSKSVARLETETFNKFTKLEDVIVHNENRVYKSIDRVLYSKDGATLIYYPVNYQAAGFKIPIGVKKVEYHGVYKCKNVQKVFMPDSVTEIGVESFNNCAKLSMLRISENLSVIPERAISYLPSLTELYIPDSVQIIKNDALKELTSLEEIVFPANLLNVTTGALSGATNLRRVFFKGAKPPHFADLSILKNVSVFVPAASLEIYKRDWAPLSNRISPYSF